MDVSNTNNQVKIGNYYVIVFTTCVHVCNRKNCDGRQTCDRSSHNWYEFGGWFTSGPISTKVIDKAYKKALKETAKERKINDAAKQAVQYLTDLKDTYEI